MKVLLYDNKAKDVGKACLIQLSDLLDKQGIEHYLLSDEDLSKDFDADVIFSLGGDGTILWLVEFSNRNRIPIIGINVGKLGFLSEFERNEIEHAVSLFNKGELKIDQRLTLKITVNGNVYYALNDAYIHREYSVEAGCLTADVNITINGVSAGKFRGDGVVVCSPTGSTAYSLSAGGPILSPEVSAFSVTPIAAHGLGNKPIVCSAQSKCELELMGKTSASLFVDGRCIGDIKAGDVVTIESADNPTTFLRKDNYDFYKRLSVKLKDIFSVG